MTISIKDYGAVGNGISDDTMAIRLALNSIKSYGDVVFFPPGIYNISETLDIPATEGVGIKLQGSGLGTTTIKRMPNFNSGHILSAYNNGNSFEGWLEIEDITFKGNASTTSGATVYVKDRSCVKINNCFINAEYLGVWLDGNIQYVSCNNILYTQATSITQAKAGFYFAGGHQADIKIDNCTVVGADPNSNNYLANGFFIETSDSVQITNCQALAAHGLNINAGKGDHVAFIYVDNCIFDTCREVGVLLQGTARLQNKLYQDIRISNCHINPYPAGGFTSPSSIGVWVTGDCDYVSILGCNINSCGGAGILIDQPDLNFLSTVYQSFQILNNTISNTNMNNVNASSIILANGVSGVQIIGNYIGNRLPNSSSKVGIALDGNNTNITIANNNLKNQTAKGVFFALPVNNVNYPNLVVNGNINANDIRV